MFNVLVFYVVYVFHFFIEDTAEPVGQHHIQAVIPDHMGITFIMVVMPGPVGGQDNVTLVHR